VVTLLRDADSTGSWPEAICTEIVANAATNTVTASVTTAWRMRLVRLRMAASFALALRLRCTSASEPACRWLRS
jgi:hypothetical protein